MKIDIGTYYLSPSLGCKSDSKCWLLVKSEKGLLLDMSDLPENYEIIIRPIYNKRKSQTIYQNFKERE